MSKKKFEENNVINELKGSSLFFERQESHEAVVESSKDTPTLAVLPLDAPREAIPSSSTPLDKTNSSASKGKENSVQESNHASNLASYHDSTIAEIRGAVKVVGKEVSYFRLTSEEKTFLGEIVYTYKSKGIRVSENEINRIALNFLLADFKANNVASILSRVIEALLA